MFAEQYHDVYGDHAKALHKEVFAPLGRYIQAERERAGWTRQSLATALDGYKNLDSAAANVANWELGKNLIGENDYRAIRAALNNGGGDYLRREYEDLRREYEDLRRTFNAPNRQLLMDVWDFKTVSPYPGKHPAEKPLLLLEHMIATSSRAGDRILDPFAGSGSTLEAARALGRKAVGIEKDEAYCEKIAERLSRKAVANA